MQTLVNMANALTNLLAQQQADQLLNPLRPRATTLRDNAIKYHNTAVGNLIEATIELILLQKASESITKESGGMVQDVTASDSEQQYKQSIEHYIQMLAYEKIVFEKYTKSNHLRAVFSGLRKDYPVNEVLARGQETVAALEKIEPIIKTLSEESSNTLVKLKKSLADQKLAIKNMLSAVRNRDVPSPVAQTSNMADVKVQMDVKTSGESSNLMALLGTNPDTILTELGTSKEKFNKLDGRKPNEREAAEKLLRKKAIECLLQFSGRFAKQLHLTEASINKKIAELCALQEKTEVAAEVEADVKAKAEAKSKIDAELSTDTDTANASAAAAASNTAKPSTTDAKSATPITFAHNQAAGSGESQSAAASAVNKKVMKASILQ